jgi:glycosyltransferase involved in cell wall biosynthesis
METKKKLKGLFWRSDFYGAHTEGGMASMHYGLLTGFQKLSVDSFFVSSGRMSLPPNVKYYFIPYSNLYRNFPEVLNLPYNKRVVKKIKKIIDIEKPDFIYQHHADFIYAGSILKEELGLPFLLQCESVQQWVKANWGKNYFKYLLKQAEEIQWENADKIVVISENVKKMMVEYGVNGDKIIVNPSAVDSNVFYPEIDPSGVINQYNLKNKFVVGFTGSFAQWHGIEVLAESIKYVTKSIPDAMFFLVGDGLLRPKIEEIIKNDNVAGKQDHAA